MKTLFRSLLLCCLFPVSGLSAETPNVLFLAVDDMNDWVNCLGGYEGTVYTPNIDRLAGRGILFTNAHCPSPKCAPSRAAIMTGLRPSTTGLYDNGHWWYPNLPDVLTLPQHFRNHGYRAVGAGKIFHHTAGNNPPNQWDDFRRLVFRNDPWFRGVRSNYPWSETTPYPKGFPYSGVKGLGHENDWGSLPIPEEEYDDQLSSDYTVRFLSGEMSCPFFLACGIFRPHLPWYAPQRFFDLYPIDEIVLPATQANDLDDVPEVGREFARSGRKDLETIRENGKWKQAIQAYLASISFADAKLGQILDALDKSPHAKNTIIVLWSDHGWHLGEKDHWHKSTLWEEATRIPFIVSGPGIPPGRCDRPVNLIDLYPTLIELCGLEPIPSLDGISLVPLLHNPDLPWERPAVIEFKKGNVAVRSERHRYIRYNDGSEELCDHRSDPHEWVNLAGQVGSAPVIAQLAQSLPATWADAAPTKAHYDFDPMTFTWTAKATGKVTSGARTEPSE